MAIHLTPTELAREAGLERRDVISKCVEMGVPIFHGRIDKTLFMTSLGQQHPAMAAPAAAPRDRIGRARWRRAANPRAAPRLVPRIGNLCISGTRRTQMDASATSGIEASTGSKTIADLLPLAAERYGDRVAVKHKHDGAWQDVTVAEVAAIAQEIGLGLVDLGIAAGRPRLDPLPHPPGVDLRDFGATEAGTCRRADLPDELARGVRVGARHSGARVVICEDAAQVAKIAEVRARLPALEHVIVIDADGASARRDRARRPARAAARTGDRTELDRAHRRGRPDDPYTIIYTSGTTGPPKGCVLTHGNYRAILTMAQSDARRRGATRSRTSTCRSRTRSRC